MVEIGPLLMLQATADEGTARKVESSRSCQAASWVEAPSLTVRVEELRTRPTISKREKVQPVLAVKWGEVLGPPMDSPSKSLLKWADWDWPPKEVGEAIAE